MPDTAERPERGRSVPMKNPVPWITVWGYGADIRATRGTLIIREGTSRRSYPLSSVDRLLIAGGHTLETAAVAHLLANDISISFFDVHGRPVGEIRPHGCDAYPLRSAQKSLPQHRFAMSVIVSSLKARLLYLNELGSGRADGLYYKGELEFLTDASRELEFLITLPELARVFSLTRSMYYEILSPCCCPGAWLPPQGKTALSGSGKRNVFSRVCGIICEYCGVCCGDRAGPCCRCSVWRCCPSGKEPQRMCSGYHGTPDDADG